MDKENDPEIVVACKKFQTLQEGRPRVLIVLRSRWRCWRFCWHGNQRNKGCSRNDGYNKQLEKENIRSKVVIQGLWMSGRLTVSGI